MGTAEDELHGSTDVRVHTSDIRVFDATWGKHFCHTFVERSILIDGNNLATFRNLEIESFTASVVVPFLHGLVVAFVRPSPKDLIADVPDTGTGPDVDDLSVHVCILHTFSFYGYTSIFKYRKQGRTPLSV